MFEVDYDPNAGEANIIKVHNNVFNNELTINTVHVWVFELNGKYVESKYDGIVSSIRNRFVPIDVLYKSNSSGEKLYLAFADEDGKASTDMIWNINCIKNIKLTRIERKENDYYEITKEQLYELCTASSLMVQISGKKGTILEGNATDAIIMFQTLYNEAIDNTKFTDAKTKALDDLNKRVKHLFEKIEEDERQQKEKERRKEKKESNSNIIWIIISAVVVIASFVWMISMW